MIDLRELRFHYKARERPLRLSRNDTPEPYPVHAIG
jgi:hypothetical protein